MARNFLTTIRSNRWGFGIHSPFVFDLVTRVIFGKPNPLRNRIPFPVIMNHREKRITEVVVRMIEFFRPEEIHVVTGPGFLQSLILEKYRNGTVFCREAKRDFERYTWFQIEYQRKSVLQKVFITPKSPKGDFLTRWFSIVPPLGGRGSEQLKTKNCIFGVDSRIKEEIEYRGNRVLILIDLKDAGTLGYFRELQNDPGVTITIEVKNMGIVIINPVYQKQNFYIRRWI